jgi:hypothetical protein
MASRQFEAPSSSSLSAEEIWTNAFQEMCQRIGPCFEQRKTWQRAQAYIRGLLSPVERKNGWQLAEEAGETTPYAMHTSWIERPGTASSCERCCAPTLGNSLQMAVLSW